MESVERLAGLNARWACSGHGPAIVEPERALDAARERYEGWLERPESAAWHACKRIAAYALMIRDGLPEARSLRDTSPMNDAGAGTGQGRIGP
jgi:hydroxyacylglutathione hydrolase